jgi:uncharacterized protein
MTEPVSRKRVLTFLDAYYAGDIEGALAFCSNDVEFSANAPVAILPHIGRHKGKGALRTMWGIVHTRYSSIRHQTPMVVAETDKVAVSIRLSLRKAGNNRMVEIDLAGFYTLRDGHIAGIREIIDTYDLVQQVLERDLSGMLTGRQPNGA